MPNPGADRPLRKVTLNLFDEDVRHIESIGWGWSTWLREMVHQIVLESKRRKGTRTLGDLE